MNTKELCIIDMAQKYANDVCQWRYSGIYSFYSHNSNDSDSFLDGTHYACVNANDDIVGYFCFGEDARIPTVEDNVYETDFLDIGLGLRPDLCGNGFGITFLNLGLDYARKRLGFVKFRLSVAAFNERAIKVYSKAGFIIEREVTNSFFKNRFYIMTLSKKLMPAIISNRKL